MIMEFNRRSDRALCEELQGQAEEVGLEEWLLSIQASFMAS